MFRGVDISETTTAVTAVAATTVDAQQSSVYGNSRTKQLQKHDFATLSVGSSLKSLHQVFFHFVDSATTPSSSFLEN